MNERDEPAEPAGEPSAEAPSISTSQPVKFELHNAFGGKRGLQPGWRLLLFAAVLWVIVETLSVISRALSRGHAHGQVGMSFTAGSLLMVEIPSFLVVLAASWIMGKVEDRTIGDYGLPARRAFGRTFWRGLVIGFAAITALLLALRIAGAMRFGGLALHGLDLWKYAVIWGAAFLCVGFFEEFTFRGYVLFTLTSGLGFWPAALGLSCLFGYVHHANSGENWIGSVSAGMFGLLFCLILRRTGDLWMAVGFHAAWDWGETYFYGVPDSGQVAHGHLLNPSFSGPAWLTGGSVGPEGSWLCLALFVVLWIGFALWLRQPKYPDPRAFAHGSDAL